MKLIVSGVAVSFICVACASPKKYVVNESVGPAPGQEIASARHGILQVYTARQEADVDLNQQVFFGDNNNSFMYEPAHTPYNVYSRNGMLAAHVRNALDENDDLPTRVILPAGNYTIDALAEGGNVTTAKVTVPVTIKEGETTVVHLERDWQPAPRMGDKKDMVRGYDGRFIGWRAATLSSAN